MEIHLSVGVTTLVALMAADRADDQVTGGGDGFAVRAFLRCRTPLIGPDRFAASAPASSPTADD
jgi:hypothetical protein